MGRGIIKYISSYLLTAKLNSKKIKPNERNKRAFVISKIFSNIIDKSCLKNSLHPELKNQETLYY